MLSVEAAQERILADIHPLGAENVALGEACGRILAEAITAPLNLPPFANSSMDGYAVIAADLAGVTADQPVTLRVIGEVPAGGVFTDAVTPGTAARIFTGAPIPAGADAVLQQELTAPGPDATVQMRRAVQVGENVRLAGSDIRTGTLLLERGAPLDASGIALLAACGFAKVQAARRPRLAIIATGDELVAPGAELGPGHIYNSNAPMLASLVQAAGGEPVVLPVARDIEADIRERFTRAQAEADLIVTSGGVSVGDHDLVRAILTEMGQMDFWRVNVRPGKPLAYGRLGAVPVVGLPGNPASSAVTFALFTRPIIRAMLGAGDIHLPRVPVILERAQTQGDRRHYARVTLRYASGSVYATPTGDQGSHRIASLLGADALAIIPEGGGQLEAGAIVDALLLR